MFWPRTLCWCGLLWLVSVWALAAPQFPALTGRIVDNANLLSAGAEASLEALLTEHEGTDSNQLVIVTLPNLEGYTIEDYGYQLGRHWGIGQKDTDNGVLLIVAATERKVRIEVGYGLEGVLTDALASNIIGTEILPAFRQGNFESGIIAGSQAIILAIKGEYQATSAASQEGPNWLAWLFLIIVVFFWIGGGGNGRGNGRLSDLAVLGGMILGGGRGGGGFGGGFSGGGGGFGGGGASGGW